MSDQLTQNQVTKVFVDQLLEQNPLLNSAKIRIDKATQKASVIDIIRLITGCASNVANIMLSRLGNSVTTQCCHLRINGKGRLTPCADAATCIEIVWALPGKAAKLFRRQSAHYLCRILGGDLTLANEIERRYVESSQEQKTFFMQNTPVPAQSCDDERRVAKRKAELDLERQEVALKRERMKLRREDLELLEHEKKILLSTVDMYEQTGMDERDTIWMKDVMRVFARQTVGRICNTGQTGSIQKLKGRPICQNERSPFTSCAQRKG